jgi:hypothetical protein
MVGSPMRFTKKTELEQKKMVSKLNDEELEDYHNFRLQVKNDKVLSPVSKYQILTSIMKEQTIELCERVIRL